MNIAFSSPGIHSLACRKYIECLRISMIFLYQIHSTLMPVIPYKTRPNLQKSQTIPDISRSVHSPCFMAKGTAMYCSGIDWYTVTAWWLSVRYEIRWSWLEMPTVCWSKYGLRISHLHWILDKLQCIMSSHDWWEFQTVFKDHWWPLAQP